MPGALCALLLAVFSQGPMPAGSIGKGQPPKQQAVKDHTPAARGQHVTPGVPLIVQVRSADRAAEAQQTAAEHQHNATTDWWLVFLTGGLLVVGGVQAGLFFWQLGLIKDSLRDTQTAAEAATKAANATEATVDTMRDTAVRQLRAYVGLRTWRSTPRQKTGAARPYAWDISAEFENYGNTPAMSTVVGIANQWVPPDAAPQWGEPDLGDAPTVDIGVHGGGSTNPVHVTFEEAVAIFEQKRRLVLLAVATYRDVFPNTPDRVTKVCIELIAQYDPRFSDKPFRFSALGPHNIST